MPISFNTIPSNLRVPFTPVEIDQSRAQQGPVLIEYTALLIGQKLAAGSAAANSLLVVTSEAQVILLAGRGSMLARMAKRWFENNQVTKTYIGVLADDGAGVAATGTITTTGPATANGTVQLYLGGDLVQVPVTAGDSANTIAAAIASAINANLDLPVTAAAVANVVTVTFRHKGLSGNQFDIRVNYQDGQALPAGVGAVIVAMSGGTTSPVLATLIAAMGDTHFHVVAHPYSDATSLTAIENEMASRFGPMRMIDGVAFTASAETHANLLTLGNGRNSPHSAIVATNKSPTPPYEYAAASAAIVAMAGALDPARPFQTLPLKGVLAPQEANRFTLSERNLLLGDGISTTKVGPGGIVQLERMITTYQVNAAGAPDTGYMDVTSMLTLLALRATFRNQILAKYPRHKLANDGTRFGAGQVVMTPKLGKAEAVAWFEQMEQLGLVEDIDQFKRDLVVERDGTDPNRLNFLLPPNLVNGLIVTATQLQFRL
jgi:phage tail sheath gpL-like